MDVACMYKSLLSIPELLDDITKQPFVSLVWLMHISCN